MKRFSSILFALVFLLSAVFPVFSETTEAVELRDGFTLTYSDRGYVSRVRDRNVKTYLKYGANTSLILQSEEPISSLYLEFDRIPDEWILTDLDTGTEYACGKELLLHEYVDVKALCLGGRKKLALTFKTAGSIAELYAFSDGTLPDWVQKWDNTQEPCDLLLVSTHSDDDQLFFAGLIPTYTARGMSVQVVCFANHWDTHERPHELLNGLWHAGLTRYPVVSQFPDEYSESVQGAESNLQRHGFSREDVLDFQVAQLRTFRPIVAVGHDLKGEYGHGQHMYNAETLAAAVALAANTDYVCEGAPNFAAWDVPRLFLHLYEENPIELNYDLPLDAFGGKSAFEVSKEAFLFHDSQQYTWFAKWVNKDKAVDISTYSPCKFGLYYAKDGDYTPKEDLFTSLLTHKELEAQEEERWREEEARLEAAKKEEAEQEKQPAPEQDELPETPETLRIWVWVLIFALALLIALTAGSLTRRTKKRR